jgi:hypothetical protein
LCEFDAASVPLEYGARKGELETIVNVGFRRLSSSWMTSRIIESRWEVWFGRDDDVDTFSERVRKCAFFLNGGGDESGIGFGVSFGYRIKMVVTPRIFRIVVTFGFIAGRLVLDLRAERVPGTDPSGWFTIGIYIRLESSHGRGGIPGASPSKNERRSAARCAGCPAVWICIVLN